MQRRQISYIPSWEGPIAGWTYTYIKKNLWRVAYLCEFDDLVQDSYVKFLTCKERYPAVVCPKRFMSLYKRSVINMLNTLSTSEIPHHEGEFDFANTVFSVSVWVNANDITSTEIVGKIGDSGDAQWQLQFETNRIEAVLLDPSSNGVFSRFSSTLNADQWYHIVAVYNTSNPENVEYAVMFISSGELQLILFPKPIFPSNLTLALIFNNCTA